MRKAATSTAMRLTRVLRTDAEQAGPVDTLRATATQARGTDAALRAATAWTGTASTTSMLAELTAGRGTVQKDAISGGIRGSIVH